jgi:hypothetical protein
MVARNQPFADFFFSIMYKKKTVTEKQNSQNSFKDRKR